MGLTDYLNTRDKRVRVETQPSSPDPSLTDSIRLDDPAFLRNFQIDVFTAAAGAGAWTSRPAVPNGYVDVLLDSWIGNDTRQATGVVTITKSGVTMYSELVTAGAAGQGANPLRTLYSPIVLPQGWSVQMGDTAVQAGDVCVFRLRYVRVKLW